MFLCHSCLEYAGKNIVNDYVNKEKVSTESEEKKDDETQDSSTTSDDSEVETERDAWSVKKKKVRAKEERSKVKSSKKDQDCPLLIEGKCPYRFTGKNCEYRHR